MTAEERAPLLERWRSQRWCQCQYQCQYRYRYKDIYTTRDWGHADGYTRLVWPWHIGI